MERILGPYTATLHAVLRIVAGFLFFQHGLPKLFGGFGSRGPAELFSQMGLAGVIEVFGGAAIALGLFDEPGRLPDLWRDGGGLLPGAPAARILAGRQRRRAGRIFCFVFLYFAATGAGKWSLDALRTS